MGKNKFKILIIRFSALGDVAMTIPVICSFAKAYPEADITVLTNANFKSLFDNLPHNVHFMGAELRGKHAGIKGLNALYKELKQFSFDYVADFHSVLRTHFLRTRFAMSGVTTAKIYKGRKEKKALTRVNNKRKVALQSNFQRYANVLIKLGFEFDLSFSSILEFSKPDFTDLNTIIGKKTDTYWVGIAPFAKHKGKIYPLRLQEKIIAHFSTQKSVKVFVFGGGKEEEKIVSDWKSTYPTIESVVGKLNMHQELMLMSQLDLMLSMDSANMHLASLVGTKVVSVWGATHPFAGFMGWNQADDCAVQVDLPCRPCSIYGQKPCFRNDYACLNQLAPERIIQKIEKMLPNSI